MRVGVIRGDLPGPIFLSDLEPTSKTNFPVDPVGQTRYISRPNPTVLQNFLAGVYASNTQDGAPAVTIAIPAGQPGAGGVPAGIQSVSALSFPVTLVNGNHTLRIKTASAASFTALTVTNGAYSTMAALITAVNTALKAAGVAATATQDSTGTLLVLQSNTVGVGSYISVDTAGNGSTFNGSTAGNLTGSTLTFTMPSAATIITALNPVVVPPATGSINVSAASILSTLGASPAAAQVANLIAPQFSETETAVQSFQVGGLAEYLKLTWNPDPHRLPALTGGPAIQVVQDDGTTAFSASTRAPLPEITAAVHNSPNTGDITITGVGLGNVEFSNDTVVIVTAGSSTPGTGAPLYVRLTQKLIAHTKTGGTQGSVSATSIVIPASLLNAQNGSNGTTALGVAGSTVQVRYESLANSNYGTAASISWSAGVSTLTGLAHQYASLVGSYITISGSTSASNNGTFRIASYVSATSVTVLNPAGVADSSGAVVWSEPAPVAFVVT